MIPHSRPHVTFEDRQAVDRVLESGKLAGGYEVTALQADIRNFMSINNTKSYYARGVSSGSTAIRLAVSYLFERGTVIAIPAIGCPTILSSVLDAGHIPVPIDVRSDDFTIDLRDVEGRNDIESVITVDMFGAPACDCDLKIPIIEDDSHSFGHTMGNVGDVVIHSFAPTKL